VLVRHLNELGFQCVRIDLRTHTVIARTDLIVEFHTAHLDAILEYVHVPRIRLAVRRIVVPPVGGEVVQSLEPCPAATGSAAAAEPIPAIALKAVPRLKEPCNTGSTCVSVAASIAPAEMLSATSLSPMPSPNKRKPAKTVWSDPCAEPTARLTVAIDARLTPLPATQRAPTTSPANSR
jgi:hypothetical protein